jgi:hypothetical protein
MEDRVKDPVVSVIMAGRDDNYRNIPDVRRKSSTFYTILRNRTASRAIQNRIEMQKHSK